jgi:hypothetical protein
MALYSVSLNRTLILSATVAVRAKNEEAAQARVEEMIAKSAFGTIAWQVTAPNFLEWQEEEDEVEIDVVQEES